MGKRLFNPPVRRDKVFIHRLLSRNTTVRPHLPAMIPLTETTKAVTWIDKYPVVFIKPVIGSLGHHIIRIENMGKKSFLVHPYRGKKTRMSASGLARYLGTLKQRRYYIQQGIPLARFNGAPFDFRVSVQKGRFGRWEISGIAAKVAREQSHMTNIAQNGKAMRAWTALNRCFPKQRIQAILNRISHLSIATCQELEKTWPAFADAGLDVGIDQKGRPWLIEVNFRDLRIIFPLAGDKKMFHRTYLNPLYYAAFLRH
ncbi:YheC/YheD family protein [Melghirimyces profundicolus]|nr:YheC/YheD family protein [Melghirimyces profundicolus]